jgi:hypothetical protein
MRIEMDPVRDPFSPGAGAPPPELVGREEILETARINLSRVRLRKPERSLLLTGLRGVGKTVLLNKIGEISADLGYLKLSIEAIESKPFVEILVPGIRSLLLELSLKEGLKDSVKKAVAVFKSFVGSMKLKVGEIELGVEIPPSLGQADSGSIELDLPDLFVEVATAAKNKDSAIILLIDEIQYLSTKDLSALILAMHKIQQQQLPFYLVAAGLPSLPRLAGEAKSYAERLFLYPEVGPLSKADTEKGLQTPVKTLGVSFTQEALEKIFTKTLGYPYFVQEWGSLSWRIATQSPITGQIVDNVSEVVIPKLDESFFRMRFDRLTNKEKKYLRAMAELGATPQRTGDIARIMQTTQQHLALTRANLLAKGMIYAPSHGLQAFTVPLFDEFILRVVPSLEIE